MKPYRATAEAETTFTGLRSNQPTTVFQVATFDFKAANFEMASKIARELVGQFDGGFELIKVEELQSEAEDEENPEVEELSMEDDE